ncbi:alanine--tRNA ligase [Candidatus Woesearchaeota archaeon]|nr:alanine--tRNA ligase [Candidatus Woesearchaeota archaeon]
MDSDKICRKFTEFFERKGHVIVPSDSLLPTDRSVLLTTAGMQQFKPYFSDADKAQQVLCCTRAASIQKCFRTSDLDEVGDDTHLTFFEMLGNFSFGDYFKEGAIKFAWEFLTEEMKVSNEKMHFSVFEGDKEVPFDKESVEAWKKIGITEDKIKKFGRGDNFWGPTGEEGPCGPTAEIYVNDVEVWNLVFNEYYMDRKMKLTKLKQQGVDTGMGLERLAMVMQGKKSIFETDLFEPIMKKIKELEKEKKVEERAMRVIADHAKGSVFLINDGIRPSNVEQGYILRRIMRRVIRYAKLLELRSDYFDELVKVVVKIYKKRYPELEKNEKEIIAVVDEEKAKFEKSLSNGLRQFEKLSKDNEISGADAFLLYQSYGFPLEITKDLAQEKCVKIDEKAFEAEVKKHQKASRAGVEKKFGGAGGFGERVARQHTATHLLHSALRQVLGDHVQQAGSDLTPERLRFDFTHPKKLTDEEKQRVEAIVNDRIKEAIPVTVEKMKYKDAVKAGALAFFKEKYPEEVSVYSVGHFSKEICAGPHVKNTSEIGGFKIKKEEASAAGVRRIKAVVG